MKRFYLLLFLASCLFANTVVTENDPSTLVNGVSMITGDLYTFDDDLVVAGAHPIRVQRGYLSSAGDWRPEAHFFAKLVVLDDRYEILEPNGTKLHYQLPPPKKHKKKKKNEPVRCRTLIEAASGLSNTASGLISARTNYQNQYLIVEPNRDWLTLYTANGSKRLYKVIRDKHQPKEETADGGYIHLEYLYALRFEVSPNGQTLEYKWDDNYNLSSITSKSPQDAIYATLTMPQLNKKEDPPKNFQFIGSDQQAVSYEYDYLKSKNKYHWMLQAIEPPDEPKRFFTHSKKQRSGDPLLLKEISLHKGRTVSIEYDTHEYFPPRVKRLYAPIGSDESLLVSHTFFYFPKDNHSYVIDAKGNKTAYFWDKEQHLVRIDSYEGSDCLHTSERFVWQSACLRSKSLFDKNQELIWSREYAYDAKGNVIEEVYSGRLCNNEPAKSIKKTTYTDSHLPLREEEPSGLVTLYEYHPNTHLLKTKILCDHNEAKIYHHYEYNEDRILVREITDDGLTKTIRQTTPKKHAPYYGMPEIVEEKYEQNGQEILLSKTVLHYGAGGRIVQKDIYDAKDLYRYSLHFSYDPKGRLERETNAMGWESIYKYDVIGNRIYSKDFSGVEIFYDNDPSNRLIKKERKGTDGIRNVFTYQYDQTHHLISETDAKGHVTSYTITPHGKRARTHLPPIATEAGNLVTPVLQSFFDSAGNEIISIDADGFSTHTEYNAYGKPIHVRHPNGAEEYWTYAVDGTLQSHKDSRGVLTNYTCDYLGRVIRKTIFFNHILSEESFQYHGLHLLSKTDAEGHQTIYAYDRAGRKIRETHANEAITYQYDEFSRNCCIEQGTLRTVQKFDVLGRIQETREEDIVTNQCLRKTITQYDRADNKTVLLHWIHDSKTQTSEYFTYDSEKRLLSKTDASGCVETTSYNDHYINQYNQRVLQKTHTDPMGLQTIDTFDTHGRIAKTQKIHAGKTLSLEEKFYNARGKLILQINTAFAPDGNSRSSRTRWEYDARGLPIMLIEAEGTAEAKITTHTYTLRGEKQTTLKPDGVLLTFMYTPLGALEKLFSSDQTVYHEMRYDKLGNLVWHDGIERKVDPKGRLLEEKSPYYTIQSSYNQMGQRLSCTCSRANFLIEYAYRGLDMTQVTRKTLRGETLYTHQYLGYDLSGNLLCSLLPNNLGQITYHYDLNSRRESIEAPGYIQKVLATDKVGNILHLLTQGNQSLFTYDPLYQLTSENGLFNHTYQYDSLYCRVEKDKEQYQINALNQISSHIFYDKNGNPLRYKDVHYKWDALDRLIRIETPEFSQTFAYDSYHRRYYAETQTSQGQKKEEYFLYDGQNEIGSLDADLEVQNLRVLGATPHAEIGAAVGIELGNNIYVPIHDLSGNIAALLPINGGDPERTYYSAFGEELGSYLSPWRFSSKRMEEKNDLVYFGRRFYQKELGRWLSPDPAGFTDGMNLYAFVHNDPLTHFDEYGLFSLMVSAPSLSFEKDQFPVTRHLLSSGAHEIYDVSVGIFGSSAWNRQNHSAINRLFGTNISSFEGAQSIMGIPVSYGTLPSPGSLLSVASRTSSLFKNVAPALQTTGKMLTKTAMQRTASVYGVTSANKTLLNQIASINKAIKAKQIWTSANKSTSVQNAFQHWKKHRHEFPELINSKQYVERTHDFFNVRDQLLTKIRPNGEILIYDLRSNTFGAFTKEGVPKTMFKPIDGISYWKRN